MKPEYQAWIDAYVSTFSKDENGQPRTRGSCGHAAKMMILSFCELRRVPGHAFTPVGVSDHWWCETPDGEIVDPTVSQFWPWMPDYSEWPRNEPIPIGKCMNCGMLCYPDSPDRNACTEQCYKELCGAYA